MEEKIAKLTEEELDAVAGGSRGNANPEVPAREVVDADGEGEDAGLSPIFRCPKCGRSLRFCICPR